MRRIHVDPWRNNTRIREFTQFKETEWPYSVDFSSAATDRGTSVSSVAWTSEGSQQLTIANTALSSGVASADVSSLSSGFGLLKVVATYADSNTESVYIKIKIEDPET